MPKALWKGDISFGLVNIPVKLYSAVESQSLGFRLLHKECYTPLKYKRYCPNCKVNVEWEDVVKGLEMKKNEYYVLTKEELEELKSERSETIEIQEFVGKEQLEPLYFSKTYFVVPSRKKEKAYFLFKYALDETGKVAIGRFVMREKEYTCSIESYKNGLILTTLNYTYELRDITKLEELKEKAKPTSKEKELAKELVSKFSVKEFDLEKYKDSFAEELKKIIRKKAKGEKIEVKPEKKPAEKNLMKALEKSLEKKKEKSELKAKSGKKKTGKK